MKKFSLILLSLMLIFMVACGGSTVDPNGGGNGGGGDDGGDDGGGGTVSIPTGRFDGTIVDSGVRSSISLDIQNGQQVILYSVGSGSDYNLRPYTKEDFDNKTINEAYHPDTFDSGAAYFVITEGNKPLLKGICVGIKPLNEDTITIIHMYDEITSFSAIELEKEINFDRYVPPKPKLEELSGTFEGKPNIGLIYTFEFTTTGDVTFTEDTMASHIEYTGSFSSGQLGEDTGFGIETTVTVTHYSSGASRTLTLEFPTMDTLKLRSGTSSTVHLLGRTR